jgi:glyoxylase-like metal-dependent hydrolase (beta-lactamase superfamily II)
MAATRRAHRWARPTDEIAMDALTMPARWIHGAADCRVTADPPLQVHQAHADFWILRQSKCVNAEGPFIYLLLGRDRALLVDTGARPAAGSTLPIRQTVDRLIQEWAAQHDQALPELVVAHSHGHSDHASGDSQFRNRPATRVLSTDAVSVHAFFGLDSAADQSAPFDLGDRQLTVLAIPGHEKASIAIYDPATATLLTGDTLYPGVLIVNDWAAFRASAARLAAFAERQPVTHVLGAHIEAKAEAGQFFAPQTPFQPNEHGLALDATHIDLLHRETIRMGAVPAGEVVTDDFIIAP